MRCFCQFILLTLYVSAIQTSIYTSLKDNLISYLKSFGDVHKSERAGAEEYKNEDIEWSHNDYNSIDDKPHPIVDWVQQKLDSFNLRQRDPEGNDKISFIEIKDAIPAHDRAAGLRAGHWPNFADIKAAKNKSKILMEAKNENRHKHIKPIVKVPYGASPVTPREAETPSIDNLFYHMDPVLNVLRKFHSARRQASRSGSGSSSSSRELKDWKEEFTELWMHKKFEALNQSRPRGDQVNMLAARPWGVPCGDPNQHDMPWGNCMLPMECEPEYRIYRGDLFCGRTQFICCSIHLTNYDMYQGFDVSFDDKSLSTDSDEKKDNTKSSDEKRKRKRERERRKRKQARKARKRKMRRNIRKIITEIKKILFKHYRNVTKERKKKTRQLKKFIKDLKKQYKKDRQSVKDLHEKEMIEVDAELHTKLLHIKDMNNDFMSNATFRDILVNGTITKEGARMLLEAYPELSAYLEARRLGRRDLNLDKDDYLEYDIEYGFLYY